MSAWLVGRRADGLVLLVAKPVSVHSSVERWAGALVGGLAVAAAGLLVLWWRGRRWSVPAATPVTRVLAVHAAAGLLLNRVPVLVATMSGGPAARAAATVVEEFGEAVAVLRLLAVVARWRSADRPAETVRGRD